MRLRFDRVFEPGVSRLAGALIWAAPAMLGPTVANREQSSGICGMVERAVDGDTLGLAVIGGEIVYEGG